MSHGGIQYEAISADCWAFEIKTETELFESSDYSDESNDAFVKSNLPPDTKQI